MMKVLDVLAKDVGMSTRQLERLFRRYLNRSPKRYYMELRLQKARNLLMQTDMSVINVALACGFASPSHFSKCYRSHYNTTPYRERGSHGRTWQRPAELRSGRGRLTGRLAADGHVICASAAWRGIRSAPYPSHETSTTGVKNVPCMEPEDAPTRHAQAYRL